MIKTTIQAVKNGPNYSQKNLMGASAEQNSVALNLTICDIVKSGPRGKSFTLDQKIWSLIKVYEDRVDTTVKTHLFENVWFENECQKLKFQVRKELTNET